LWYSPAKVDSNFVQREENPHAFFCFALPQSQVKEKSTNLPDTVGASSATNE
jgi:hypothetical protein